MMPFEKMRNWMNEEKRLGSPNPENIVLATTTTQGVPHSRIVAMREILPDGILFFTQSEKRKAKELMQNIHASMTLWLLLQQKQVILEGKTIAICEADNDKYWSNLPRHRQLIFSVYSPFSDHEIVSTLELQEKFILLENQYKDQSIPRENHYMGFKLIPADIYFYSLGGESFSELIKYKFEKNNWKAKYLSP